MERGVTLRTDETHVFLEDGFPRKSGLDARIDLKFGCYAESYLCIQIMRSIRLRVVQNIAKSFSKIMLLFDPSMGL